MDNIILEEVLRLERVGGLDIQKIITKIYPGEMHIYDQGDDKVFRKDSFCGPGTKLDDRLKNFNHETGEYDYVITEGQNQLDRGCMEHDISYTTSKDLEGRHVADRELIRVANLVIKNKKSTFIQKLSARLVKAVIGSKLKFGMGTVDEDLYEFYEMFHSIN